MELYFVHRNKPKQLVISSQTTFLPTKESLNRIGLRKRTIKSMANHIEYLAAYIQNISATPSDKTC